MPYAVGRGKCHDQRRLCIGECTICIAGTDWGGSPFCPAAVLASARGALRGVQTPGLWLWLVRPGIAEVIAAFTLVLLDRLPGLLVAAAEWLGRLV